MIMKQRTKVLILLFVSSLVRSTFISNAAGADCITECMERSGCWSGRSISDPHGCNVQPQLCRTQCQGKSSNGWGAIAYSKKDKISGWSFEQDNKATAERVAVQYCSKSGGAQCVVETSFNSICGAIAADGDVVAWGTSGTKVSAQQRATAECTKLGGKKCEVESSVCSSANSSAGPPSPSRPPKNISWGAIAYSSMDMGAGWSQGKDDRASAEKEALTACAQRGKACVLRTAFNKQCGALAADREFTGWGTSADQREALRQAMEECQKAGGTRCMPHISFCSF
jgi:hypothetical protein